MSAPSRCLASATGIGDGDTAQKHLFPAGRQLERELLKARACDPISALSCIPRFFAWLARARSVTSNNHLIFPPAPAARLASTAVRVPAACGEAELQA